MKFWLSRFCLLALLVFAVTVAEARDWGFGKDTVYESNTDGDLVWLVNNGADTLEIDSLFIEVFEAPFWQDVEFMYFSARPEPSEEVTYRFYPDSDTSKRATRRVLLPSDSGYFMGFDVGIECILSKRTADNGPEQDILAVRLRLQSVGGESDSLIVKGHPCSTSLLPPEGVSREGDLKSEGRDPLGRKVRSTRPFPLMVTPPPD